MCVFPDQFASDPFAANFDSQQNAGFTSDPFASFGNSGIVNSKSIQNKVTSFIFQAARVIHSLIHLGKRQLLPELQK